MYLFLNFDSPQVKEKNATKKMGGLPQIKFAMKKKLNVNSHLVAHRMMLQFLLNHFHKFLRYNKFYRTLNKIKSELFNSTM
jgi:hypothetical protein